MFPRFSKFNILNRASANTESASDPILRKRPLRQHYSYFLNLFNGQFMMGMIFGMWRSTFPSHVGAVFWSCAQKKVVWTNTSSIIAFVKNTQTFWNWTIVTLPGVTMSLNFFKVNKKPTIPILISFSNPFPTIANRNFSPKSFIRRLIHKQEIRQPYRVKQAEESLAAEPADKLSFFFRAVSTLATG